MGDVTRERSEAEGQCVECGERKSLLINAFHGFTRFAAHIARARAAPRRTSETDAVVYISRGVAAILQQRLHWCGQDVQCGLNPIGHA